MTCGRFNLYEMSERTFFILIIFDIMDAER